MALTLRQNKTSYREETKKAKYLLSSILGLELGYSSYVNMIETHLDNLKDVKLAHKTLENGRKMNGGCGFRLVMPDPDHR